MERFVKGDVVVVPFPYVDFSSAKRRPAVVVAALEGDDLILCEVTSSRTDKYSVQIEVSDFKKGNLNITSNARPNRLFTFYSKSIEYKIGTLKESKINEIMHRIQEIFNA